MLNIPMKDVQVNPFVVKGSCQTGDHFPSIRSIQDLHDQAHNLECIFTSGCDFGGVPTGNLPGEMLSAIGIPQLSKIINKAYRGEFVFPFHCQKQGGFIGTTNIANKSVATGLYSSSSFYTDPSEFPPLAEGQGAFGDHQYLLMDFTINPNDLCPLYMDSDSVHTDSLIPIKSSPPPGAGYVDAGTIVGETEDGNPIILAKAFGYNPGSNFSPLSGKMRRDWANVLFYAFVVNNPVSPFFTYDSSTCDWGTVTKTFDYDYTPIIDIHLAGFQAFPRFALTRGSNLAAMVKDKDRVSKWASFLSPKKNNGFLNFSLF